MSRQAYDIEHKFNEELSFDRWDEVYEDKLGGRQYYSGKKITDFYHNQWTGYKKPDWYHPYNGIDVRSQYLYRKWTDDWAWFLPPYLDMALYWIEGNRMWLYLAAFLIIDVYWGAKNYKKNKQDDGKLELLEISFSLDAM